MCMKSDWVGRTDRIDKVLTVTVRADLWPWALIGLSRSLGGLPKDPGVSGPGGHTTAAQVVAPLSQTEKTKRSKWRKNIIHYQKKERTRLDSSWTKTKLISRCCCVHYWLILQAWLPGNTAVVNGITLTAREGCGFDYQLGLLLFVWLPDQLSDRPVADKNKELESMVWPATLEAVTAVTDQEPPTKIFHKNKLEWFDAILQHSVEIFPTHFICCEQSSHLTVVPDI